MIRFEWDENKLPKNIEVRSLDFLDATLAFGGRPVATASSRYPMEERWISTALLEDGKACTVVWTP